MVQDTKDWSEIIRIIMIILLYGQPQFLRVKNKDQICIQAENHTTLEGRKLQN